LRVALPLDLDIHSWSPDKVAAVPYLTLLYITLYSIKLHYVTLACESQRNIIDSLWKFFRQIPDITQLRISDERFSLKYKVNNVKSHYRPRKDVARRLFPVLMKEEFSWNFGGGDFFLSTLR
jgi:hypothetical protein